MTPELLALTLADLDYVQALDRIWHDQQDDVPALHAGVAANIMADFVQLARPDSTRPLGRVVRGQNGTGKTHLLGTLRRLVWGAGGWFVTIEPDSATGFWEAAVLGFVSALGRRLPDGRTQAAHVLSRLIDPVPEEPPSRRWFGIWPRGAGPAGAAVRQPLRRLDPHESLRHRDTITAVVHLEGADEDRRDLAYRWLRGMALDATEARALGVRGHLPAREAVTGLSWLLAQAGPTMVAVDQVDAAIAARSTQNGAAKDDLDGLAIGLMDLYDVTRRSLTVVSLLETTWELLRTSTVRSFEARFRTPISLQPLLDAGVARDLVERRLGPAYAEAGVAPPYPSWPFRPEAFGTALQLTPRRLLVLCRDHVDLCRARGSVAELTAFEGSAPGPAPGGGGDVASRYAMLVATLPPPDSASDEDMTALVRAALTAWCRQQEPDAVWLDTAPRGLAARLTLRGSPDRVLCLAVVQGANAINVLNRLKAALDASGVDRSRAWPRLVLVRGASWPGGAKVADIVAGMQGLGILRLVPEAEDVRRFAAMLRLLQEPSAELDAWLRERRPMDDSPFLRAIGLFDPAPDQPAPQPPGIGPVIAPPPIAPPHPPIPPSGEPLPLGHRVGDNMPVSLAPVALTRHMAVIAGAGSGKTVLLRRLTEEAVIAGIPVILIDSNNDLVRLADPWPEPPPGLSAEDRGRADRYFAGADVVVWTPGRARGNPLGLDPLPDFAALRHDEEDLAAAVDVAASLIEPLVVPRLTQDSVPAGVLRDALRHFARHGQGGLAALVELLRDLPPEASQISSAHKQGEQLANKLLAAMSRNPLLADSAGRLDPATLLQGPPGRVRVSVVNLVGLADEAARQNFVGRLLMALFGHIRRHPASDARPVSALLVMDEAHNFASRSSASAPAIRALARQARKYGLGLVFATHAPKDVDHNVINNCATMLFGKINSAAAVETARDMLANLGGSGSDLGRLAAGTFYLATEGAKPVRMKAPLCLSHHPQSPPSEDEVIERAARSRPT